MSVSSSTRASPGPVARPVGVWRLLDRPLASYWLLVGSALPLLGLGLVMVLSASGVVSFAQTGSSYTIFQRQLLWVGMGLPAAFVASRLPVRFYRRIAYPLLLVSLGLLVLVLVPGLGVSVNGNQNWLALSGSLRMQPSEVAKLALVVWGADLLARKEPLLHRWSHLMVPLLPVAGLLLALVLLGGDLGTSLVLMAVAGGLLLFAGAPARVLATLTGLGLAGIGVLSMSRGYRMGRIQAWLHPAADPLGVGWQALHGKYALASGGWWGLGLGASRQKWGALPEAYTDFIFAIVGEELGLAGTLTLLALVALICLAGLRIALRSSDTFVRLAAAGVSVWFMVQSLVNIGAVIGVLPVTGIPLPLVSYGGSSLLLIMVALGMLAAFARAEPAAAAMLSSRRTSSRRTSSRLGAVPPHRCDAP
ncbi:MAG: putative lipid II flippase FtsW [Actinomycetes bacterium]